VNIIFDINKYTHIHLLENITVKLMSLRSLTRRDVHEEPDVAPLSTMQTKLHEECRALEALLNIAKLINSLNKNVVEKLEEELCEAKRRVKLIDDQIDRANEEETRKNPMARGDDQKKINSSPKRETIDPLHAAHPLLYGMLSKDTKGNESRMESRSGTQPHSMMIMESGGSTASKDGEKKINSSSKRKTINPRSQLHDIISNISSKRAKDDQNKVGSMKSGGSMANKGMKKRKYAETDDEVDDMADIGNTGTSSGTLATTTTITNKRIDKDDDEED